jgi:hypothetical protein
MNPTSPPQPRQRAPPSPSHIVEAKTRGSPISGRDAALRGPVAIRWGIDARFVGLV